MDPVRQVMDTVADADTGNELYGALAPLYDIFFAERCDYDALATFVSDRAPAGARSVAVGACGTGRLLARLADRYDCAVGLDSSAAMLRLAAGRTDAALVRADLRTVTAPGAFDLLTVTGNSLAHLPAGDPDGVRTAFESAAESLTPGGTLVCDFMLTDSLMNGYATEDTVETERCRVERRVVTRIEDRGADSLGQAGRYDYEFTMTDRRTGETVRAEASLPVRVFESGALPGVARSVGFTETALVDPPTPYGGGLMARVPE
ncbi:class I SAM-dependent DNA methyltransferase [Haloglomus halophilum]|uniref:class I SAM-dependent DNA methyltransferase n=1 Tax=Haloglomus halophilum TaxID=2962672 RepID=UPI0020C9AA84|nr:class I SAM-dependent methyltransferase [Haloglomus halophilum]